MTGQPRSALVGLSLASALTVLAGCTPAPAPVRRDPAVPALKLVAFDDCADLLTGLRAAAKQAVGPYGLPGDQQAIPLAAGAGVVPGARSAIDAIPEKSTPDHSGTNTNEAGADEPDLVKTDGRRIVTVANGSLRVVDAASRRVTGSLVLADNIVDANLLLAGDHALVLATTTQRAKQPGSNRAGDYLMRPVLTSAELFLVDLSGTPRTVGRYTFDGSLVDARQVGSTARIVLRSQPRLPFRLDGDRPDEARIADNRQVIDSAPVEQWLPAYTVDSGGKQSTGRVDCHAVSRPDTYSASSLLTVLSFDVAATTLGTGDPTSLVADGDTVYANTTSLYVATDDRWRTVPTFRSGGAPIRRDERTAVYKFDISGTRPRYVAGGTVPGWLINQYAMSEWDGRLRVATTLSQPDDQTGKAESSVYVLDGALRRVGHLDGLGKGERIYAVRFVGPTGYVVTFRQTDPLYVVDLRDPTAPKLTGELKINGYSAYLHPAANGRLIGLGRQAGDDGRVSGLQVSIFDVADPAHPTRLSQYAVSGGYSEAEYDPHAFLYWPATGLLVVPMSAPTGTTGALALTLSGNSITAASSVDAPRAEQIRRSLVVGNDLWTLSDSTIVAYDLHTLAKLAEL